MSGVLAFTAWLGVGGWRASEDGVDRVPYLKGMLLLLLVLLLKYYSDEKNVESLILKQK